MGKMANVLAAVALAAISFGVMPARAGLPKASEGKAVGEGGNEFAAKLYGQLKENKGNIFFSPYSISASLAMAVDKKVTARMMRDRFDEVISC